MFLDTLISNLHKSIYRYPEVIKYLNSRYVTDEDIIKYQIGYNNIVGIPEDSNKDRERMSEECYRGRKLERKIIFPLKDAMGNVVGIVGRAVESKEFIKFVTDEVKYTGFFFGFPQALFCAYEKDKIYVVEGPFDFFALLKVYPNTVATLTSWLSEAQYSFLKFYCNKIVTVFDTDKAGILGREKALEYKDVIMMDLKNYKDPSICLEKLKLNNFKKFILKQSPAEIM